jgi:DNA-binding NtrC family response regulator
LPVEESWHLADASIESAHRKGPLGGLGRLKSDEEKQMIESALFETAGRIAGPSGAAAKLCIPRQTLESRIARLGIDKYRFKSKETTRNRHLPA